MARAQTVEGKAQSGPMVALAAAVEVVVHPSLTPLRTPRQVVQLVVLVPLSLLVVQTLLPLPVVARNHPHRPARSASMVTRSSSWKKKEEMGSHPHLHLQNGLSSHVPLPTGQRDWMVLV